MFRAGTALAASGMLCTSGVMAGGNIVYTTIAANGMTSPVTGGVYTSVLGWPGNKAAGSATFVGVTEAGPGGPGGAGLWRVGTTNSQLLLMIGQSTPYGPGTTWTNFSQPVVNRRGAAIFSAIVDGGGGTFLFSSGSGLAEVITLQNDPNQAGLPTMYTLYHPGAVAINDDDLVAFVSRTESVPGKQVIVVVDPSTGVYDLRAVQFDMVSPTSGLDFEHFSGPGINSRGDVAFHAMFYKYPYEGFYGRRQGGEFETVLEFGQPAPGFAEGLTIGRLYRYTPHHWGYSGPPAFNDHGVFAVSAQVWNGPWNVVCAALWRGKPGAFQLVARGGDPAPGATPGAMFHDFLARINRAGVICAESYLGTAQFASGGNGIWTFGLDGQPRLVALTQMPAPDMPGWVFPSIGPLKHAFNNRAEVLVFPTVRETASGATKAAIFAGRAGRLRKVVGVGDVLEITPGVHRTVSSLSCWTGNGPDMGQETSLNDRGEVTFSCNLVGGGSAVIRAQLPHPCPGDANCDDRVDFLDLNHVLGDFGRSGPEFIEGDVNSDGAVDFLDLNWVLSGFGSAC
ncbi:MAG: dockerin type I repeat-containing protein [Phycisphaerales bacterium]